MVIIPHRSRILRKTYNTMFSELITVLFSSALAQKTRKSTTFCGAFLLIIYLIHYSLYITASIVLPD